MKIKQAFSLLETSIVILVISLLVFSISEIQDMIDSAKLNNANSLTESSPVAGISDLKMWLESTSENSFQASEASDGSSVSTWYDLNPQSIVKNNATASTTAKPTYTVDAGLGLPLLRFDGVANFMSFDGTYLIGKSYTIFVVESRRSAKNDNYFIAGSDISVANANLILGYSSDTSIIQDHYSNNLYCDVATYSSPSLKIHTFLFDSTIGRTYTMKGGGANFVASDDQTSPLISYAGASVGKYSSNFYEGDIGEIIVFARALEASEITAIEAYLAKKWRIVI